MIDTIFPAFFDKNELILVIVIYTLKTNYYNIFCFLFFKIYSIQSMLLISHFTLMFIFVFIKFYSNLTDLGETNARRSERNTRIYDTY